MTVMVRQDPSEGRDQLCQRLSLEMIIRRFAAELSQLFANRIERRPKAFKRRVVDLIGMALPPYPKPSGRPRQARITKATAMYVRQRGEKVEGHRKRINWNPIANSCLAGYRKIRSLAKRQAEIRRLRNSVYARLRSLAGSK